MSGLLAALGPVIALIIRHLAELFMEKANEPTIAVDADSDPALRDRLIERVRRAKGSASTPR